jgi:endonuclease/exonuclease/phosphatase family metal-dependent hydrolase
LKNPWLYIPVADYEGHMACREVRQLDALADLFAEAVEFAQAECGERGLDRYFYSEKLTRTVCPGVPASSSAVASTSHLPVN